MATALYKAPDTNFWSTTLNGAINSSVTSITLNSVTDLNYPGFLVIDREDSNGTATPTSREVIYFTGITGSGLTGVTRAADGSTARSHSDGALVEAVLTVGMWNDVRDWAATEHSTVGAHTTDTISEKTSAAGVTVDGIKHKDSIVYTDTIAEKTAAAGVTIDGLQIKDSKAVYVDNAPNINVKAKAYRVTTNQTLTTNTETKIQLNGEIYDVGADFDNVTNFRFTAPVTGYYSIKGTVFYASNATGFRVCVIKKNNSGLGVALVPAVNGDATAVNFSNDYLLTAGDYIELFGNQTSGGDLAVVAGEGNTSMSVRLVSV